MKWVSQYRGNKLARNTAWLMLAQGLSLIFQAAYFVLIARGLGAKEYGAFVGTAALTQIISPFVGIGGEFLLVKHVARDRAQFNVCYGNLLFAVLASGLGSSLFVVAIARIVLPKSIDILVIACVCLAELIFFRLLDCASMSFQAIERFDVNAILRCSAPLIRLAGIIVLVSCVTHPTAVHWSIVYLLTTMFLSALGLGWVQAVIGGPRLALNRWKSEYSEGLFFSLGVSAQSIYDNIDKTMLARLSTLDAVGIYAAAYRIIDVAFVPVRSLLNAAYPGFFRAGKQGISSAANYMRHLLAKSAGYSCLAFLGLVLCAPLVRTVLGAQYAQTVEALRWLAVLPLLKSVHYFLADALTCSGHQGLRALIQTIVAGTNVLINLWIIPTYSWRGAAWSSIASDGLLAIVMYLAVRTILIGPLAKTPEAELIS